ncbi:MAG TPA: FG-GAP-like repeat-containing protein [Nitrospinota bacterium]|nr:FG-GAP-like repeat-containing protein [Nitrospinota bacterium]
MYRLKRFLIIFAIYLISSNCTPQTYHPAINNPSFLIEKSHYTGLTIADFNDDGLIDIAEAKYPSGEIDIKMGGSKMSSSVTLKTKGEVLALDSADYNNDGKKDIIFSGGKKNPGIHVFLNQGRNEWRLLEDVADHQIYLKIKAGDFNNDGNIDIAGLLTTQKKRSGFKGGIKIWLQKEKNSKLILSGLKFDNPFQDFDIGDINGDKVLDIAAADSRPYGGIKIFLGDGKGDWTFSSPPPATNGDFLSVNISDLNSDGKNDVVAGSFLYGIKIWLNNGYGRWKEYPTPTKSGSFWSIVNSDINGDGIKDILAGSFDSQGIRVWVSTKNNYWNKGPELISSFSIMYSINSFDINGDNQVDLAAISHGDGIKLFPLNQETQEKYFLAKNLFEGHNDKDLIRKVSFDSFKINGFNNNLLEKYILANKTGRDQKGKSSNNGYKPYIEINGTSKYIVGPGDVLSVTFWKASTPNISSVLVREDGKISYSYLDDLKVEGLTISQIDTLITNRLKKYIKKPRIDVTMEKYKSKTVFLLGEFTSTARGVSGGGTYKFPLEGKTTLVDLLWEAGGVTDNANMTNITIHRRDKIMTFDLSKVFTEGIIEQNPILETGDRIKIAKIPEEEKKKKIFVLGEVDNPHVYKFTKKATVAEVLSASKGLDHVKMSRHISIIRGDFANPRVIPIDTKKLLRHGDLSQNIALLDGDILFVPRSDIQIAQDFLGHISGLANSLIFMGVLRDTYTTGGTFLRFNTGGALGGQAVGVTLGP